MEVVSAVGSGQGVAPLTSNKKRSSTRQENNVKSIPSTAAHLTRSLSLYLTLPLYLSLMTHIASIFGGAAAHGELLKFLYRRWNVLRSVHRMGDRLALNAIKLIPSKCHQITQKLLTSLIFIYVYPILSHLLHHLLSRRGDAAGIDELFSATFIALEIRKRNP